LHDRYKTTGTVIQAYLYRSRKDVEMLCARGIRVRLCKGAYLEPPAVAFKSKADVDRNFVELMNLLLETGVYPAIATHDEKIVEQTKRFVESRKIRATPSNSRCFTAFAAISRSGWLAKDIGCGCMCPTGRRGIHISCGGWRSGRPMSSSWRATCCGVDGPRAGNLVLRAGI
jgi:hypothetical protein